MVLGCSKHAPEAPDPYTYELVRSTQPPADPPVVYATYPVGFLLNFYYIDCVWFYDEHVDTAVLRRTLEMVVTKCPALACRRLKAGWTLNNAGVRYSVSDNHPGSAREASQVYHNVLPGKRNLCDEPRSIAGGKEPIMTVRVTNYADGTSAVGVAISHVFADGGSYIKLVSALSHAHMTGDVSGIPDFNFDQMSVMEAAMPRDVVDKSDTKGLSFMPLSTLEWMNPLTESITRNVFKLQRAKVHLTLDDLNELKRDASATLPEGARKATNNEALAAAMALAMARRYNACHPGFKPGVPQKFFGTQVDIRGKSLLKESHNVIGNIGQTVYIEAKGSIATTPPASLTMGQVLQAMRDVGDKWRDPETVNTLVDNFVGSMRWMQLHGTLPSKGKFFYRATFGTPVTELFGLNNQSAFASPQIRFGAGSLIAYSPFNCGPAGFLAVASAEPPGTARSPPRQPSLVKQVVGAFGDAAKAFSEHDTDVSGSLSKAEFVAALNLQHVEVDDAEVDELFERMDKDGNGEIEANEFDAAFYAARLTGGIDVYGASAELKPLVCSPPAVLALI